MTLDPGELIADRFEVEAAVGGGGMSLLYSARDRQSGERVAVKLMAGDRASVARFGREVQVLAELDHPAIVRYVGHGEARGGRPFLAMEWLEGEDLGTRLRRGALPVDDALQLAERVAQALGAAHARGVVHRDVKPTNLFLPGGRVEQVKVLDFGIARTAFGPELTQTQARIGTPAYMSPEQARGDRQIGAPADVFGLGVVLYQALTGRKPFVGDDLMALIARILLDDPPPLRDALPGCPPAVDRVVMQMLAKEPDQRFGDGAALATALADLRAALGADTGPAPAGALGGAEHRLACLVLARGVGAEVRGEVERIADTLGARSTPMADGTVAVLLAGAEVATDLTARGARAALAVRAAAPHAPIALVTGRALVAGRAPVGEVIDRAVGLLRSLRPRRGAATARPAPATPRRRGPGRGYCCPRPPRRRHRRGRSRPPAPPTTPARARSWSTTSPPGCSILASRSAASPAGWRCAASARPRSRAPCSAGRPRSSPATPSWPRSRARTPRRSTSRARARC